MATLSMAPGTTRPIRFVRGTRFATGRQSTGSRVPLTLDPEHELEPRRRGVAGAAEYLFMRTVYGMTSCAMFRRRPSSGMAEGLRVQVDYHGEGKYFLATVTAVHRGGQVLTVRYNDGDEETEVPAARVLAIDADRGFDAALSVGQTVTANYHDEGSWYKGKVASLDERAGTVDVLYDDGDREARVPRSRVRGAASPVSLGSSAASARVLCVASEVCADADNTSRSKGSAALSSCGVGS